MATGYVSVLIPTAQAGRPAGRPEGSRVSKGGPVKWDGFSSQGVRDIIS